MLIDLTTLGGGPVYHLMTQTVIPRPIAWILTANDDSGLNLAPFSYFTAVSSSPPILMVSIGPRPDRTPKDTRRNIERGGWFVVHIAPSSLLGALNGSAGGLAPGESEVTAQGLDTAAVTDWPLPRLVGPKVAYLCKLHQVVELGAQGLMFGEITSAWLDDAVVSVNDRGRLKVHADKVDPLARLGAAEYATLGDVLSLKRPR
ncbi:MAG: flavin reductase (DIM6/NTAB) family NADH-FMN oxidoreductase RutF [Myxococcota bacterium]|jgi:flavin reductase (DIM6/NTAB) family NADH-FMN oxidoreductase RutF